MRWDGSIASCPFMGTAFRSFHRVIAPQLMTTFSVKDPTTSDLLTNSVCTKVTVSSRREMGGSKRRIGNRINIRLTITEGSELVVQLDTLSLAPHSQVTRVYDVPAKKLMVFAGAVGGAEATTRWTC